MNIEEVQVWYVVVSIMVTLDWYNKSIWKPQLKSFITFVHLISLPPSLFSLIFWFEIVVFLHSSYQIYNSGCLYLGKFRTSTRIEWLVIKLWDFILLVEELIALIIGMVKLRIGICCNIKYELSKNNTYITFNR